MSNNRRRGKIESVSIQAPKGSWASMVFDALYPFLIAIIVIAAALYAGYIEPGQLSDLLPSSMRNLVAHWL